jgi:hypothetical protein
MEQTATTDMAGVPHSDIVLRNSTGAVMTFGTGGPSATIRRPACSSCTSGRQVGSIT